MSDDDSTSPLWKFATDHALVFGAEVLTKLNEFEVKIFYDLCRASRAVVIRSKIELNNKKRYVYDIKSMCKSTRRIIIVYNKSLSSSY